MTAHGGPETREPVVVKVGEMMKESGHVCPTCNQFHKDKRFPAPKCIHCGLPKFWADDDACTRLDGHEFAPTEGEPETRQERLDREGLTEAEVYEGALTGVDGAGEPVYNPPAPTVAGDAETEDEEAFDRIFAVLKAVTDAHGHDVLGDVHVLRGRLRYQRRLARERGDDIARLRSTPEAEEIIEGVVVYEEINSTLHRIMVEKRAPDMADPYGYSRCTLILLAATPPEHGDAE